jgi:hypothetical protein
MLSKRQEIRDPQKKYKNATLNEKKEFMGVMERAITRLIDKVEELPNIDAHGNSECPFVEDLYVEKEEAEEKVIKDLKELQLYKKYKDEDVTHSCRFWRKPATHSG